MKLKGQRDTGPQGQMVKGGKTAISHVSQGIGNISLGL